MPTNLPNLCSEERHYYAGEETFLLSALTEDTATILQTIRFRNARNKIVWKKSFQYFLFGKCAVMLKPDGRITSEPWCPEVTLAITAIAHVSECQRSGRRSTSSAFTVPSFHVHSTLFHAIGQNLVTWRYLTGKALECSYCRWPYPT